MITLRNTETVTVTVPVGDALTVSAAAGSGAAVTNYSDFSTAATVTGATTVFGPFAQTTRLTLACTAGAVAWDIALAAVPSYITDTASKAYADALVLGLLDDRGNFDASVNTYPTAGGSGASGAILKGDVWTISVVATAGALLNVPVGATVRALADAPGQTGSKWAAVADTDSVGGAGSFTTLAASGVSSLSDTLVLPKTSGKGIKVDNAAPTWGWRDMIGPIQTRDTGGTVPAMATWQGGLKQYSFTIEGLLEVFNEFHILHDYVPASDLYIHAHWSTAAAPTGAINWLFEVSYAKGYTQGVFEGTVGTAASITIPVLQTSVSAFEHMIAETQLSTPGGLLASAATVSIGAGGSTLTSDLGIFSAADIGRSIQIAGAGAAGVALNTTISAYGSSTSVTVANAATTAVVAAVALSYRLLDSNLLETDGLIVVRTWRDAARAADTLNVAPFLHFVDCHYQSTSLGTKQRNGPGFWA